MFKLKEEDAEEMVCYDSPCTLNNLETDLPEFEIVDAAAWYGGGKYQYKKTIFRVLETDKLYRLDSNRTGSHFTDWNVHHQLNCPEVVRKERTVVEVYYE